MRLAEMLDLPATERSSLFYALLLKDAGCSSNAAKVAELYGADDAAVKRDRRTTDHLRPAQSLAHLWRATSPGRPLQKASRLRALVGHGSSGSRALTRAALRARGAHRAAGGPERHDRHRDPPSRRALGRQRVSGRPGGRHDLAGRADPLPGPDHGGLLAERRPPRRRRRGARAARHLVRPLARRARRPLEGDGAFWAALAAGEVAGHEPADRVVLAGEQHLDRIAQAFAQVVDAKSPYTARHSAGVTEIADGMAAMLGMDAAERRDLRRAALLHDIGKLGVSNRILDKPGKLDDGEWLAMRRHPT
jgi:hypothetical protein